MVVFSKFIAVYYYDQFRKFFASEKNIHSSTLSTMDDNFAKISITLCKLATLLAVTPQGKKSSQAARKLLC